MRNGFQHITKARISQGLEIFEVNNCRYYAFLKLRRNRDELVIVQEQISTDLGELAFVIDKRNPLTLVFNTAKVLQKIISEEEHRPPEQWITQAFPNLDVENFYYQILDSPDFKVVSISKKSEVDNQLDELREKGIVPSKIAIGISEVSNTLPYLDFPIQGSSFAVNKENNDLLAITNSNNNDGCTIDMNGLSLSCTSLLSFSSILGALNKIQAPSNLFGLNQSLDYSFKNKRFFNLGLYLGVSVILVILLINFVLFSYYRSKTFDLDTIAGLKNKTHILNQTKDRIANKESKLKALTSNSNSKVTFYLDRIGNSLPASILLDELNFQPLLQPVQDNKPIETIQNTIVVSGRTNSKDEFTRWADILEQMEWVETVEIQSFEFDTKNSNRFTLKIGIHETGQQK